MHTPVGHEQVFDPCREHLIQDARTQEGWVDVPVARRRPLVLRIFWVGGRPQSASIHLGAHVLFSRFGNWGWKLLRIGAKGVIVSYQLAQRISK